MLNVLLRLQLFWDARTRCAGKLDRDAIAGFEYLGITLASEDVCVYSIGRSEAIWHGSSSLHSGRSTHVDVNPPMLFLCARGRFRDHS